MSKIKFTTIALKDLMEIEAYSLTNWGKKKTHEYFSEFETALALIEQDPQVLRPIPEFSASLRFYRVRSHFFVCDVLAETIFILTVMHGNMDIMQRLSELEPTLKHEVEVLRKM